MFYVSTKDSSLQFQWSSINELDKLPSLRALQCNNNPFMDTEKNPETLIQLIIAKISQLEVLNNCEVCDISTNCTSLAKTLNHCLRNYFQFKIIDCLGAVKVKCQLVHPLVSRATRLSLFVSIANSAGTWTRWVNGGFFLSSWIVWSCRTVNKNHTLKNKKKK